MSHVIQHQCSLSSNPLIWFLLSLSGRQLIYSLWMWSLFGYGTKSSGANVYRCENIAVFEIWHKCWYISRLYDTVVGMDDRACNLCRVGIWFWEVMFEKLRISSASYQYHLWVTNISLAGHSRVTNINARSYEYIVIFKHHAETGLELSLAFETLPQYKLWNRT